MSEDFIQHSEERRSLPDAISVMALTFAHVVRLPSSDKSDKQTERLCKEDCIQLGS